MTSTHPIELTIETESPKIKAGSPVRLHLVAQLHVRAPGIEVTRPPMSLVFALDVSGSMSGEPLEQVKRSTEQILGRLQPQDRAGVVAFDDRASTVARMGPANAPSLVAAVRRLQTRGSTNVEAGLRAARSLFPRRAAHERQAVVLLSDGQPNCGADTPEALAAVARSMRPDISISTLGYGRSHDEHLLMAVAEGGGGRYEFISDPQVARRGFARVIGAQVDVAVEAVELAIVPAQGVELVRGPSIIPLGDMTHGERRTIAVQLLVARAPEGKRAVAQVALLYRLAGTTEIRRIDETLEIEAGTQAGPPALGPLHGILVVRADEVRKESLALAAAGDTKRAADLLREALRAIELAPGFAANDGTPLSEAREQLIDDLFTVEESRSAGEVHAYARAQRGGLAGNGARASAEVFASPSSRAISEQSAGQFPIAVLVSENDGKVYPLRAQNILGRSRTCDIVLASGKVSRQHAAIYAQDGVFWVEDLGSSCGALLNRRRLRTDRLSPGDVLEVGDFALRYQELSKPSISAGRGWHE